MKAIKIYLVVVTVLLLAALALGVYVWYQIQTVEQKEVPTATKDVKAEKSTPAETKQASSENISASGTPRAPITVDVSTLSPTQQETLRAFGYNANTFTLTEAMISCAESAVGKERLNTIMNGAAPTPLESLKLLPCFKK